MKTECVKTMSAAAVAAMVFGVLGWAGGAAAQGNDLPETMDFPVTFYDFRSNRSNPEFEQPHGKVSTACKANAGETNCIRTGMVADKLDGDNKPQLGPEPYRNYGVAHWFRDWNTYLTGPYSKGKNTAPVYDAIKGDAPPNNDGGEWDSEVKLVERVGNVGHDTSFKNIVIQGNLRFRLTSRATGTYEFDRRKNSTEGGFFPLDGQGFGNEWVYAEPSGGKKHNFAFTMEWSYVFEAKERMSFKFSGDDDVWVFINENLVLDVGGIHSEQTKSFSISDFDWIKPGNKYTLRVFYAERHSSESNILIQTNIVAPPSDIAIDSKGNDGKNLVNSTESSAGDSIHLWSVIYNEAGKVMMPGDGDYDCNHVSWYVGGVLKGTGCDMWFNETQARTVDIKVVYQKPGKDPISKPISMKVKALPPKYINIQRTPTPKTATAKSTPKELSDDIYFGPGDSIVKVYAILRDEYNNFVAFAIDTSNVDWQHNWSSAGAAFWVSVDTAVAKASPDRSATPNIIKGYMGAGTSGDLAVSYTFYPPGCNPSNGASCKVTITDTVRVGSKSTGQLAVGPNPFTPGPGGPSLQEALGGPGSKILDFYKDVIENSVGGPGGKGVLIAVDADGPLKGSGSGKGARYGKVTIYDAVGNVVKSDNLYASNGARSSYGFVWDGKNAKGRYVGPGTYLVRVSGELKGDGKSDAGAFKFQRMIGVKK